jgi:hypothetical protein
MDVGALMRTLSDQVASAASTQQRLARARAFQEQVQASGASSGGISLHGILSALRASTAPLRARGAFQLRLAVFVSSSSSVEGEQRNENLRSLEEDSLEVSCATSTWSF